MTDVAQFPSFSGTSDFICFSKYNLHSEIGMKLKDPTKEDYSHTYNLCYTGLIMHAYRRAGQETFAYRTQKTFLQSVHI
jgi:hypothetical protein